MPEPSGVPMGGRPLDVVAIGASTGGPKAVERILRELPVDFPAPVIVCQHMPPGFTSLWAERLDGALGFDVREARYGDDLRAGTVYVAPAGRHVRVTAEGRRGSILLDPDFADSLHVPSIDILMSSVASSFGSRALGVLLTGLGSDGASGMLAMRRAGGHTICEAEESAVAYSMPQSAVELGAAAEQIPLDHMATVIDSRVRGVV